jgi:hypothetical protein
MPTPYETFMTNISNALQLIDIAKGVADPNSKQLLYRSAIVLSVAHWQNYNEELVGQYADLIRQRATSSENLPGIVRREIGKWVMRKQAVHKYPEKAAKLIWDYAGGIWKDHYGEFAREIIKELNTPNSKKLVELYRGILGIEDISKDWARFLTAYPPSEALDRILNTRHEIAHGSFNGTLTEKQMIDDTAILQEIAGVTHLVVSYETGMLLENCGSHYSLDSFDLRGLIKWLVTLPEPRIFSVDDLRAINPNWYGNHKKLSHTVWDLLQGPPSHRTTTDTFNKFISGEISIPYEIVSFDGVDSIAKPGTSMVFFKDL